MLIARALLDELIEHAREEAPNECCGVIAASAGEPRTATRAHRAVNTAASPLRFEVDGLQLLHTIEAIEDGGEQLAAIYHSHTRTAPYPSQTDINFAANWPGLEWLIVGLSAAQEPQVRSYLIVDGAVQEVPIGEPAA